MGRGKKATAETVESTGWDESSIEDDKPGQFLIRGSQTVADPRADTGATGKTKPGMKKIVRIGVFGERAGHRSDNAEIIDGPSHVRKELADFETALSVLRKPPGGPEDGPIVVELSSLNRNRKRFPIIFLNPRLRVKSVDL